jgi:hypothetical protein
MRLRPVDDEFFQRVAFNVTSSNALPFEIPVDRFLPIVVRCAKYFWEWYIDATFEQTLFIPNSAINSKDKNGNCIVQLPNGIEGISGVWSTNTYAGVSLSTALRVPLLDSISTSYKAFNYSGLSSSGYTGDKSQISDSIMALMEYDLYNSTLRKGLQFSFSRHTSQLNVIGNPYSNHIILRCFIRHQMEVLYNDILFEDYVTACIMSELGKIVMSFDFQLPGGVKMNYDEIKSEGKEKKKEIEDRLKDEQNNSMIMFR